MTRGTINSTHPLYDGHTLFALARDGRVARIRDGFASPATGDAHSGL
jgi:hypothetical protein